MTTNRFNFEKEHHAQAAAPAEAPAHQNQRKEEGKAKGKEKGKIQETNPGKGINSYHDTIIVYSKTGRDDDPDSPSDHDHGMDTGSPMAASS